MSFSLDTVPEPWLSRFKFLGAVKSPSVKAVVLVGGCVRDKLLGRAPFDWDIMVEGDIGPVLSAGEKQFSTVKTVRHPAFMTATLHFSDGTALDVVTARTETYPRPAALPAVKPAILVEDFRRRDFTVNALAAHITPNRWGELVDPFGGREDLKNGLIRVLHDQSFADDPTRLYRAARYAGRYGWSLEEKTRELVLEAVHGGRPALLSPARRRNELTHLLNEPNAAPAMKLLWDWGAWKYWSTALTWTPSLAAALSTPAKDPLPTRLAALVQTGDRDAILKDLSALTFPKKIIHPFPAT